MGRPSTTTTTTTNHDNDNSTTTTTTNHNNNDNNNDNSASSGRPREGPRAQAPASWTGPGADYQFANCYHRDFTKGGLVKGGLAIYVLLLYVYC